MQLNNVENVKKKKKVNAMQDCVNILYRDLD